MTFNGFAIDRIIMRDVSPSMNECEQEGHHTIDVEACEKQLLSYANALTAQSHSIIMMDASKDYPDCVFCEDTAVIIDWDLAMITNPGAKSRRGEVAETIRCLETMKHLEIMPPTALLDGGDVLRHKDTFFVGLSERTNLQGISFLEHVAASKGFHVKKLDVPSGLHLKSSLSLADENTLIYYEDFNLPIDIFKQAGLECLKTSEFAGANVLYLGHQTALVSQAAPKTAQLLKDLGIQVVPVNIEEFHKADGALTCPSLRIPKKGYWCS